MRKTVKQHSWDRGYHEYFWFATILFVLLICFASRRPVLSKAPEDSFLEPTKDNLGFARH